MRINEFFRSRLGAPLHNPRQSWGSHDVQSNRVFLRIGSWAIDDYDDGYRWAIVYDPAWRKPSAGHAERLKHLDAIRSGAEGYAVIVEYNDDDKIKSFDHEKLLLLDKIEEEGGLIYARVVGECSVDEIGRSQPVQENATRDLSELAHAEIPETERQALIAARIGQGAFRNQILKNWEGKCAVTGAAVIEAIRASHIKPWKDCTPKERLDPANGLPLVATLDALFDAGLITFDSSGALVRSSLLSELEAVRLSLTGIRLRVRPSDLTLTYLRYHREQVFRS